jgi:phosphate transport system permease protein
MGRSRDITLRNTAEAIVEKLLGFAGLVTILITVGIIWVLLSESLTFFETVPLPQFLFDTEWTPLFSEKRYGILPLLSGTFLTTMIAMVTAVPVGIVIAIYLSEYSGRRFRKTVKPVMEMLAAVPSVVYGFFALTVVTPFLKTFIPGLGSFNALSAGLVMGIMIIPVISSLSEDALYAVPKSLREASYGMGATKFQTAWKVVVPAAASGITVSVILGLARAIGETMVVAIAAGQQPNLTFDPREGIETITAYIVQVSLGDVSHQSLEYKTIFAAGITLFIFTFLLNNVSFWLKKKYQEKYE